MIDKNKIINAIKIHPSKVKSIYLFGSRIYGTARFDSDYDILVVANSVNESQEIVHEDLNIHVYTPELFMRNLKDLRMSNLERIFAPGECKIVENIKYECKINSDALKYKAMSQSYNSLQKAKRQFMDMNLTDGSKSLFHSLRILMFATQILKLGKIYDFSEANVYWESIKFDASLTKNITDGHELWRYYKEKYLVEKIKLETDLKNIS